MATGRSCLAAARAAPTSPVAPPGRSDRDSCQLPLAEPTRLNPAGCHREHRAGPARARQHLRDCESTSRATATSGTPGHSACCQVPQLPW